MYSIEIENLSKTYQKSSRSKGKKALENINLKIKKGSFFGLLGPNGAGKSTLINILSAITNKSEGTVKIGGIDIDEDQKSSKFKIGIVPQEIIFDPFFTVYETLEIYAGYFGVRKENRKTNEILKAMGLLDKAHSKPRSLSGGMKRRLLIAKALVHDPEILVLDEPTAGVDVDLRTQLWDYVKKLNKMGTTILLTTHYLEEAEELCDEIAIINHGKLIAHDTKENLMTVLSKKELIIQTNEEIKILDKIFPDLETRNLPGNKISINYDPKKTEIEKILRILEKNKVKINDILTKQPDLEEIFKHLITS
jgi:ABC-2 type transport system ATP-binding protein